MAQRPMWISKEPVYIGDAFGNARQVGVGVVKVNNRTTVGLQFQDNDSNLPDYTLDAAAVGDLIAELTRQRSELLNTPGGLQ